MKVESWGYAGWSHRKLRFKKTIEKEYKRDLAQADLKLLISRDPPT